MSEFDAAIRILWGQLAGASSLATLGSLVSEGMELEVAENQIRSAIKLLEAAEKIDKKKESYCPGGVNPYPLIRSFLCAWSNKRYRGVCDDEKYCEDRNDCRKYKAQILALLDALPGGGR